MRPAQCLEVSPPPGNQSRPGAPGAQWSPVQRLESGPETGHFPRTNRDEDSGFRLQEAPQGLVLFPFPSRPRPLTATELRLRGPALGGGAELRWLWGGGHTSP